MPPVMTVAAPTAAPVTFPKWYTEAPLDEAPSDEIALPLDDEPDGGLVDCGLCEEG